MNCTEFDQHWQRRLDVGAGVTPIKLLTHLAECPRCQAWHRAWEVLERAIDDSSAVDRVNKPALLQSDLVDRVLAELQADSSRPAELIRTGAMGLVADHPENKVGHATVAGTNRGAVLRLTALTSAVMVLGLAWLHRPLSQGPEPLSPPSLAAAMPPAESPAKALAKPGDEEPSARSHNGTLASNRSMNTIVGESYWNEPLVSPNSPRPPLVKPLVGVVHNLTSLVLPGWPSVLNDSVGIPHFLDGEGFNSRANPSVSSPIPAPLAFVRGTEVPWPEPVEELLAVATESVQTMWDLANRW
jgi:hypothetical protein